MVARPWLPFLLSWGGHESHPKVLLPLLPQKGGNFLDPGSSESQSTTQGSLLWPQRGRSMEEPSQVALPDEGSLQDRDSEGSLAKES